MTVRFLAAHTCFEHPRLRLAVETFSTPDGDVERPVIHHPGAVAVLAQPAPQQVLMVRQYRYPIQRETLELPAGTRVPGELPETTAARELAEEAGFAASTWRELLRFLPAPGISDEELILYHADGLSRVPCAPEHGELVAPEIIRIEDIARLRADGLICDAKTLIGLTFVPGYTP